MKLFKKNKSTGTGANTNAQSTNDSSTPAKARIYNLIIVDESGSMSHLRNVTLSGINETIDTIREAQKKFADTQIHTLSLVTFDSNGNRPPVRAVIYNEPIARVENFTNYQPYGCTPLYDAMGQSLSTLYNAIKDDPDATAVVTVMTDGMENSSTEWNAHDLRKLIEKLKEEGWSFSYMGSAHDVKQVTDLLSINNVVEFSHDNLGAGNTWERECSSRNAYYEKMNRMYGEGDFSYERKMQEKRRFAKEYYSDRVTPNRIDHLEENEIFVFGSNNLGKHTGGASAYAVQHFGAVIGQAEGLQGQSYAIPTVGDPHQMAAAIERFVHFAANHRELRFLVTPIGCGNAGFTPEQIAPLFADCIKLENVALPAPFWQVLGLNMKY